MERITTDEMIQLPDPSAEGHVSLETAISNRRSVRRFKDKALSLADISQLLWAAQGVTNRRGFRAAPSAGALYPLEVYLIAGNVTELPPGIYRYLPAHHGLALGRKGDFREALYNAALKQRAIRQAPAVLVFCAVYDRTKAKYGKRGERYVHMEVGHAAQNVCLQAVAIHLGSVPIGAFHDNPVRDLVTAGPDEDPLYLLPVGRPATNGP